MGGWCWVAITINNAAFQHGPKGQQACLSLRAGKARHRSCGVCPNAWRLPHTSPAPGGLPSMWEGEQKRERGEKPLY